LLLEVADSLDAGSAVALSVDCPPGLEVLAQRDLAEQIVVNLAANAVKHTEAGTIVLNARRLRESVVLEVRDSGRGIAAVDQERIFDRFYSGGGAERDGVGLGLAIVREAVRALGATLEVESRLGAGTTMRVTLASADSVERVA
jgi:signal transduction histidine kinase